MKIQRKTMYIFMSILAVMGIFLVQTNKSLAQTAIVQVQVSSSIVSISATGTLNLGSIISSTITGSLSGQYPANSFTVTDLKGSTGGYTTTIQSTALTGSIQGVTQTIAASNIYVKAGNNPTFVSGYPNPSVVFGVGISSGTYTSLSGAQTYFSKNALGTTGGIFSTYGDAPRIKIDIPPYQPAASYQATLTFTLMSS